MNGFLSLTSEARKYKEADAEIGMLYGKLTGGLDKGSITDLEINEDGRCFIQNAMGERKEIEAPLSFTEISLLGGLLASCDGKLLNAGNPIFDTQVLYDDARLNITVPNVTANPTLSLRFHHIVFRSLDRLVEAGMLSGACADTLRGFVRSKRNIIISGETGSGKSTLLNALANEIGADERVIVIEDTRELLIENVRNVVYMTTTKGADSVACVQACLRKNPDRIIYGEVRGGEALSLIEAWNTAHRGGLATIHANSAEAVRTRLKSLCGRASAMDQSDMIAEAVETVVQIGIRNGKRTIVEISDKGASTKI